nr:uncharacterized protein LOC115259000 [Aedes albopictus]XP_029715375.1 uncharacterized protein LOC115259000 [Aedes albopictus]
MSGRKSGKDGKSGSKGARSKEKESEAIDIGGGDNVVVVVTEEEQDPKDLFRKDRGVEQNCTFCQEKDSDEMVQCDKCDRWIHFACVGVTEEIADKSWSCPKCVTTTGFQQPSPSAVNRNRTGSSGRAERLVSKEIHGSVRCHSLSEPAGRTFAAGTANRDKTVKSVSSSSSRRSILQLQLQRLEEEREYERLQAEKHRAYMDRKYELLEQMHSQTGSECSRSQDRIRQWVHDTNNVPAEDALDPRATEVFDPQRHSTQYYSGQAQVGSPPPANLNRHRNDRTYVGPDERCGPHREQPFSTAFGKQGSRRSFRTTQPSAKEDVSRNRSPFRPPGGRFRAVFVLSAAAGSSPRNLQRFAQVLRQVRGVAGLHVDVQ